ncbi:MAG: hypothetical protein JNM25_02900 [Planctomycetes bacterium]|nr:hypothetical protein [Planctomycetota bacterium]
MTKNLADELQRTARQALTSIDPVPQGEEPGGLPLRRVLAAAFRARYLVFTTTLFGLLIGSFMAITTPNTYLSTGKFLFTASGAEAKLVDPTRSTDISQETIGTAASHILTTDDLLKRVIKRLGPARILAPYQPDEATASSGAKAAFYRIQRDWNATDEQATEEDALKVLRKNLLVERPRGIDVLIATYVANNAHLAQEVLDTFMKEAITWHIEQYDDKRAYEDAEKAATDSKVAREAARLALRDFLDNKAGVTQFEDEKKRLEKEEEEASHRQDALRQELDSAEQVLAGIVKRLDVDKDVPKFIVEKRRMDVSGGALESLNNEYGAEQVRLTGLMGQYRDPTNPRIVEVQQKIESIKATILRLQQEASNAPEEEISVPNPLYAQMMERRTLLANEVWELRVKKSNADEIAGEKRARLRTLLSLEPEYAKLRDAKVTAEEQATLAQANWNIAQQKRALGAGNFSSLKEIQTASLPLEKEGPNRGRLLIGGFFAGLFLGLGIVVMRSLPDSIVRTRDDLERIEGLAVIGIMPRLDGGNLRRHVSMREQGW